MQKLEGGLRLKGISKTSQKGLPLISVITSVFNGEKTLKQTIESIINQGYKNIEYIIVDAGSKDKTVDILKEYSDRLDYWVSEPDKGIYDAWNKGVSLAKGEWIAFVGSDDIYLKDALQNYVDFIGDKKFDYVSSRVELVNQDMSKVLNVIGTAWKWSVFKNYMNVAHVGSFHNRSLFERFGKYNIDFRIVGDYEFLLRPKRGMNAGFLDKVTVKMRAGGGSNISSSVLKETMRAKINTAGRSKLISYFEYLVGYIKFYLRRWFLNY